MTDVAELAGVSHMTVSRVINDADSVRSETRAKVLAAIRELHYRPNSAARTLASGRSRSLGVVTLDSTLYGPASTLYGIETAARHADYTISIASVRAPNRKSIGEAVDSLRAQAVDGIVVIAPHASAVRALAGLPGQVPVVAVGGAGGGKVPVVAVDQFHGARLATNHLLGLGHPTVCHIAGPADWLEAQAREKGWRKTLENAGVAVPAVLRGDWSSRSGYELGRRLTRRRHRSAVFVANDQMALGVLRALSEAGISVPGEVSLVGFDDIPEAAYFSPPLTTVRQDFIELGQRTLSLLLERIGHEQRGTLPVVAPELIVRHSTAAP